MKNSQLDLPKITRSQCKSARVDSGLTEGEVALATSKEGKPLPAEISWSGDGGALGKSSTIVNQEIEVNSFYFTRGQQLKSFPREITLGTNRYAFHDGLQFMVQNGQKIVRLFNMTDGSTNYRLRNEKDHWVLLDMKTVVG